MELDFAGRSPLVIGLSGGIDSYVCVAEAMRLHIPVTGFHAIMRRPVAIMERSAAKALAAEKNFYLEIVDFRRTLEMQVGYLPFASIAADEYDVVAEWDAETPVTAFTVLLNSMLYYTQISGRSGLVVGLTREQASRRDASGGFKHVHEAIQSFNPDTDPPIVIAPLMGLDKPDIIRLGYELGVEFEKTWSCVSLNPGVKHCGICKGCVDRKNGFKGQSFSDPTEYAE